MRRTILIPIFLLIVMLLPASIDAQSKTEIFSDAKWIAMVSDSTVLFPHIHLLKPESQQAISLTRYASPVLSKTFSLSKKVKHAGLNICGLGQYTLFINGYRVGDNFLDPGWTMYNRRLYYNSYNLTGILKQQGSGTDITLSVILGGGMYDIPVQGYHKFAGSCGAPKLLLSLSGSYTDGTPFKIVSDETWTAAESPVRYCSIYAGETYDATFTAPQQSVVITSPHWEVPLQHQDDRTRLKVKSELPMTQIASDSNIYDSHQNCSGIVRIKVKGKRGKTIRLCPAETLHGNRIFQKCQPGYTWTYKLRGDSDGETWQPLFSYAGFRYIEVIADKGVELQSLTALHTSANISETGHFLCSDTLFNRIYNLIDWSISSNLASITTDCPTREKLGWQEQNHLMAYSMMYRYDMQALMNKIADDLADSQHSNGAIPTIAPEYTVFNAGSGFDDTPEWGASFILCPYYTYLWYGDDSAIRTHYNSMKRYISYLDSRSDGGILDYGLGDWFDVGPNKPGKAQLTSVALSATAIYYYELTIMHKIARMLGRTTDADYFDVRAGLVKRAFNQKFWNPLTASYGQGSQTASSMALFMGLVTDSTRQSTVDCLVRDIKSRIDGTGTIVTAGDIGYRYVLQSLLQSGHSQLVWQMNRRNDIPGYAYQLQHGATSLTESWQAYDNLSLNHLMLGHLMEWFFESPGGITQAENSIGWEHIIIAPEMVGELTWADTSLDTPHGTICCKWKSSADHTNWSITVNVPKGSDAEVRLPDGCIIRGVTGKHKYSKKK